MVISISGASHSGKTTAIESLECDDIIIHNEIIRDYCISSIDDIRKDSNKYFELQREIITKKINQEIEAYTNINDKIHIFDRSIVDSYYYFKKYVDYDSLKNKETYNRFDNYLKNYIKFSFEFIYDKIILFNPIDASNNTDNFRPNDIKYIQHIEFNKIKEMTELFAISLKNTKLYNYDAVMDTDYKILIKIVGVN